MDWNEHPIDTIDGFRFDENRQEVWVLTCDHWILYSDIRIEDGMDYLIANGVPELE